jgi:hypothetical protein
MHEARSSESARDVVGGMAGALERREGKGLAIHDRPE